MNLVVLERDVVLVDGVPLLDADLLRPRAHLRRHELLEVPHRVVLVALDADLLAQAVVQDHLDHRRVRFLPVSASQGAKWVESEIISDLYSEIIRIVISVSIVRIEMEEQIYRFLLDDVALDVCFEVQ